MQTLYDDNRSVGQAHLVANPLTATCLEVKGGNLNLFTVKKRLDMLGEKLGVDGVDVLKVDLAVRAGLDLVTVDVVVVKAHENWLLAMDTKLGGESVRRGCLAR